MNLHLQAILEGFVGQRCWKVILGSGTGTHVSIGFGEAIKRSRAIANPTLTEDERKFDAAYTIMIYCAWRLRCGKTRIVSSTDRNLHSDVKLNAFKAIRNASVVGVGFTPIVFDLSINFSNEMVLDIFTDRTGSNGMLTNYDIFSPRGNISLEMDGELGVF